MFFNRYLLYIVRVLGSLLVIVFRNFDIVFVHYVYNVKL